MNLNMNRGFESMIPREKPKPKEALFRNQIAFRLFNKRITFMFEVK